MTEKQKEFLHRAVIRQETYDEISQAIGEDRKMFTQWWEELREEREQLAAIRKLWMTKIKPEENDANSFESFRKWYLSAEQKCHYCGITEEQIGQLWKLEPVLTKRKRGRILEIDRKRPNDSYDDTQNLVLSCYWCNNAKTDTFSEEEFKEVGQAIRGIWEKRFGK